MEPRKLVVTFGKHNGSTLGTIEEEDFPYLRWLAGKETKPKAIGDCARTILNEPRYKDLAFDTAMPFGKHEGESLGHIYEEDPGYLEFVVESMTDLNPQLKADIEHVLGSLR